MKMLTVLVRFDEVQFDSEQFTKQLHEVLNNFKAWTYTTSVTPVENQGTLRGAIAYVIDQPAFDALTNGMEQPGTLWRVRRDKAYLKADTILALKPSDYTQDGK